MTARVFSIFDGSERHHANGDATVNPAAVQPWGVTSEDIAKWQRAIRDSEAAARRTMFRVVAPDRGRTEEG